MKLADRLTRAVRSSLILAMSTLALGAHLSCRDATPRQPESGRPAEPAAPSAPEKQAEPEAGALKESVQTQKTINRYFQDTVLPKLEPCWKRLQGNGTIVMKLVFARAGDGWTGRTVEASESSLSPDQTSAAAKCMQQAVQGTALALEAPREYQTYSLHWSWPVPLPADTSEQLARMQNETGGEGDKSGCDGHGAAPRCVTCAGFPFQCVAVCVGGDPPCKITENPLPGGMRTCTLETGCASGGLFGLVGGRMIF